MPFISIITTTYKHQDFIAQTIESILSQSFTDWELLIGDDSPDNPTWEIIQEYVQKYPDKIKAWHHSPNKGIVGNMNFLLEQMNPESQYVAFLEGDDIFTPNNLEEKMKFFELFPEKNFVYTGWSKIDAEGMVIEKDACKKFYQNLSLAEMIDIQKNFIHSFGCVAFKKGILNKIFPLVSPNKEKMFGNLDYFTWLKLLPIIHFGYIQENLLFYRIHTNNFSGGVNKGKMTQELIEIYEYFFQKNITDKNLSGIFGYCIAHLKMYLAYLQNDKLDTIKYGFISFRYSLTKNFFERIGMIVLSLVPEKLNEFLYKKFKK